jgi:hypothetical protein
MEEKIFNGYSFDVIKEMITELKTLILANQIYTPGKASLSERSEFLVGHLYNCSCSKLEIGNLKNNSFKYWNTAKIEQLINYAEKNILEL